MLYVVQCFDVKVCLIMQNWLWLVYYLKCDLVNFFVSIDKWILLDLLLVKIFELFWCVLMVFVLMYDLWVDFVYLGDFVMLECVLLYKCLMEQLVYFGLFIGNLLLQFFVNVYLNELDQFIKYELCFKYYICYVDDFVLLYECLQWFNEVYVVIVVFLLVWFGVCLNFKKIIL